MVPVVDRVLNQREARAWDSYVQMTHLVLAQIGRDLTRNTNLSVADHDVLCALACAPEQSARLGALSETISWEPSRLSHHLHRMEARNLVERRSCAEDGRGVSYALTEAGRSAICEAGPVHDHAVRTHMLRTLTQDELDQLAQISEKVLAAHDRNDTNPHKK